MFFFYYIQIILVLGYGLLLLAGYIQPDKENFQMEQKSLTALISVFSRVYHFRNNKVRIFSDSFGQKLISKEEYQQISNSMVQGINFFNPNFNGTNEEALRWIVDNQLSPTPLGRAAYTEKMLENAAKVSAAKQYLIFASGYDTFAYRQPEYAKSLQIFEIDHPLTLEDKKMRVNAILDDKIENLHYIPADFTQDNWQDNILSCPAFDKEKHSFCSLMGICYYLSKEDFTKMINKISQLVPEGSSIVFDYQDQYTYTEKASERMKKQLLLAGGAGEKMLGAYSYQEMEELLANCGFLIYEHLEPKEITEHFFKEYNNANPKNQMSAFENVNYCFAVKKKI